MNEGSPKTYVIEFGPISHYGRTPAELARMERQTLREAESFVRSYLRVGPRSKVVRSRIGEAT